MRNPPFPQYPGKTGTLRELLENPVFANIVRAFLLLLLSLGVYIWKTELAHVTDALGEIKISVNASLAQQREELKALREEMAGTNREMDRVLLRTLPVENPHELAYLYSEGPWQGNISARERTATSRSAGSARRTRGFFNRSKARML